VKTQPDGSIERFKARLVAKGFSQVEGADYFETYAPVSRYTTTRALLAVITLRQLYTVQLDVKNAFLYGDLDAEIYMKQPPGYEDGTGRVCRVLRSLYGLKQLPKLW